ncbi:MAG: hypothetical protein U5L96_04765 [Owenweeksia sp.]|nr:hypothetical protein [Owenweeksia sp.]
MQIQFIGILVMVAILLIINPKHSYTMPGTYVVSLYALSACDADTLVDTLSVCDTLRANFSTNQLGDTVVFNAAASQGASQYFGTWVMVPIRVELSLTTFIAVLGSKT